MSIAEKDYNQLVEAFAYGEDPHQIWNKLSQGAKADIMNLVGAKKWIDVFQSIKQSVSIRYR